jgi:hypothetical protein
MFFFMEGEERGKGSFTGAGCPLQQPVQLQQLWSATAASAVKPWHQELRDCHTLAVVT